MWPQASITACYSIPAQNAALLISSFFLITDFLWHSLSPHLGALQTQCASWQPVKWAVDLLFSNDCSWTILLAWGIHGEVFPRAVNVLCHQLSVCPSARQGPVHGKSSLEATEPPKLAFSNTIGASLYSERLCQNSESSCHIALIKRARDCYHRVMGSCWSINVEVELEAFMETMWKPGIYSQSRQHRSFLPVFSYNVFIPVQMRGIFI